MKKSVPKGIRIFAILLIITSIIGILVLPFSIFFVLKGEIIVFPEKSLQFNKIYTLINGIIVIIESIISLFLAAGVLKLKEKYRKFLVGFTILVLTLVIINTLIRPFLGIIVSLSPSNIFNMIISFGFYILILWYFNKPKVKAVFR